MINRSSIRNGKAKILLLAFLLIYALSIAAIAQESIGSGFAESVGSKKVNESTNATIGSGFAESIDGNESNTTKNMSNENATSMGGGFAKSMGLNETKAKPWWQFW